VILSYLLSLPFVAIHNPSTCYLVTHCCTSNLSANHSNTKKRCISPSSQLLSSSLLPLRSPSPTRPPPAQPVLPSQFSKHALPALKQLLPPAAAQITPVSARNGLMCRRSFPSFFLSPSSNPDHITNTSGTVASSNAPTIPDPQPPSPLAQPTATMLPSTPPPLALPSLALSPRHIAPLLALQPPPLAPAALSRSQAALLVVPWLLQHLLQQQRRAVLVQMSSMVDWSVWLESWLPSCRYYTRHP
jgi:hypothetical protein